MFNVSTVNIIINKSLIIPKYFYAFYWILLRFPPEKKKIMKTNTNPKSLAWKIKIGTIFKGLTIVIILLYFASRRTGSGEGVR